MTVSSHTSINCAHPGEGDVVGVLKGGVANEAGRPHAVGGHGDDLQEEHVVRVLEGPRLRATGACAEAEDAQPRVLRVHER